MFTVNHFEVSSEMDKTSFSKSKAGKSSHPKQAASCLSNLFFCWTLPLFLKGFRKKVTEADLAGTLPEHGSKNLGDRLQKLWKLEKVLYDNPSLWRVLWEIFGTQTVVYGFSVFLIEFVVKLSQPLGIWKLMIYYTPSDHSVTDLEAQVYAGVIVISSLANVFLFHSYTFGVQELGMKLRIACCSLIYRKALKLSKGAMTETTSGQIVNLLSNDVNRFDSFLVKIHYLWAAPLETLIIMVLLYILLSPTAIAGGAIYLVFIPILMYEGKVWSDLRSKVAVKTDERARLLNEIICGIRIIKMYTWEKLFEARMDKARKQEMRYVRFASYLRAFHTSFAKYVTRSAVFLCILTYILTGHHVEARYIFVVKSFYTLLKDSMTVNFPIAVGSLAETISSIKRIETFLLTEEVVLTKPPQQPKTIQTYYSSFVRKSRTNIGINLSNVTAKWTTNEILTTINFAASSAQLVALVGPVGSGKSSLLKVILDELPIISGTKEIVGRISYACHEPWLFAGTIQQNILFGQEMNRQRYQEVIKACALERDFSLLKFGDGSIVGDRGITLSGGQKARINLARAVYREADIYLLDGPLAAVDNYVARQLFEECFLKLLTGKCVVLITHQLQLLEKVDVIYWMENGRITTSGSYDQIKSTRREFKKIQDNLESEDNVNSSSDKENDFLGSENANQVEEMGQTTKIDLRAYWRYFTSGGCCSFLSVILLHVISQVLASGLDYFEAYLVDLEENITTTKMSLIRDNCIYIYSGLMILTIVFTILRSVCFFLYFVRVSTKLHNQTFYSVIKTTLNFFNTTPSGRILNRFCKDMGTIDEVLPSVLADTIQVGLNVLAITLIIAIVNPLSLFATVALLALCYAFREFYLTTSRELKRLESRTRSPVFSHLNETVQGLTTIRAFGVQEAQADQFDSYQDQHTSAFYMYLGCTATFGFWLDLFCAFYIALVTTSCLWSKDTSGGSVGLIITQAFGLTGTFQWGMKQWSEVENQMISVERVVEYSKLSPESDQIKQQPPKNWPELCEIEFKSVSLKYFQGAPPSLDQLTFKLAPKEKVGVIGRTGAGKSSLLSALLRLVVYEGEILIDNVNIEVVPLEMVRSKISVIPQEPVLFSGTIRENLDPFSRFPDLKLWQILEELELKEFVANCPNGLETLISENGANLSVGQRQLFCLARALLLDNKILVLDEATANVDLKTDALIQSTIRRKFVDCTVLVIAHRLHTIMDCDKVLVMDAGKIVEFGHPHKLVLNKDGALRDFVLKTGKLTADKLMENAEKNYKECRNGEENVE